MSHQAAIGLGTVQWGMPYGIANRSGLPGPEQIEAMLRLAHDRGIKTLDTAPGYGRAESLLGDNHAAARFRIITKTKPLQGGELTEADVQAVAEAFEESLARLSCRTVDGLLVHHPDVLLKKDGQRLWTVLDRIRQEGRALKIGVSVYHPGQLEALLERYRIDLVQLPFNIYDQRFMQSGLLQRVKRLGVEVHARSAFLQGVLLSPSSKLPPYFDAIRTHHVRLHRLLADSGMTPLTGCLQHCLRQPDIDAVIVGCETLGQLGDILDAAQECAVRLPPVASYALVDERFLNPSRWACAPV